MQLFLCILDITINTILNNVYCKIITPFFFPRLTSVKVGEFKLGFIENFNTSY